jgi:hypothetical protein
MTSGGAEGGRRELLKVLACAVAGLVARRLRAEPAPERAPARPARIRTRPLTREDLYRAHDKAG